MDQFKLFFSQLTVRQALLVDNLKTFLVITKHSYSANLPKSMKVFMEEFINFLKDRQTNGKLSNKHDIIETLKSMDVNSPEDFGNLFKKMRDSKTKFYSLTKIKFGKSKKEKKMTFHSHNSVDGLDLQRTIAIRSKYGNYPVKFYELKGSMNSKVNPEVNGFKMEYHFETECSYYEARPILYATWIELDPAHQQATCICDRQD